jgi:alpha,alpha-trehalase
MKEETLFFIESLGALYEDVQLARIFADSKYFVDCIPKYPAGDILDDYENKKNLPGFDLKKFVEDWFILPQETASDYSSSNKDIITHINDLWDELKRTADTRGGTLINLPKDYIVPGGRFREIYYWDSYFTMLGLQVSGKTALIASMLDNFAFLINEFGFIPNGNRTYYLGRSQPPFFALMVQLLAEEKGESVFMKFAPALEKEYHFWMNGETQLDKDNRAINHVVLMGDGSVLNRYWDMKDEPRPEASLEDKEVAEKSGRNEASVYRHLRAAAASGWDFSSRWFADKKNIETIHTTDIIPVDLNCLLLFMEETLLKIYRQQNDDANVSLFEMKTIKRKKAIQTWCWSEVAGCYFDVDFVAGKQVEHYNLATLFPLFFQIALPPQAEKITELVKQKFLHGGGLVTSIYNSGQQWDAPNGWAPLQWITFKGLKNYGFNQLADEVKHNWLSHCEKVFKETGKMMEKYNVMDEGAKGGGGEYPNQDGFGWTNGVYLKMKNS